jgi:hypothetical protein
MKRIVIAGIFVASSLIGAVAANADVLTTGVIAANGTKQSNGPFTVTHPSTGRYLITLTSYTGTPLCMVNAIGMATNVGGLFVNTKTCDVRFVNKKNKATDILFTFFAAPLS